MWYSTEFKWTLKFKEGMTVKWLAFLNTILWEDARDHEEWNAGNLTRMDLEVTKELDGIQWNWSEKTYDLDTKIALIIHLMSEKFPEFWIDWELLANWEEFDDIWKIIVKDNKVERRELKIQWEVIECPHCEEKFIHWE